MEIEVWSDVVCPWCYLGKRRLERAIRAVPGAADAVITHRAFQLDPTAVTRGERTVDHLAHKYGVDADGVAAMMRTVTEAAATEGLAYDLGGTLTGNTVLAHRLVLWAQEQGKGPELLDLLYDAYFVNSAPVFELEDLLPYVTSAGLDANQARAAMATDAFLVQVAEDQELARAFGANGVPFFVIDRKYGISGAQPYELFVQTLERALEEA